MTNQENKTMLTDLYQLTMLASYQDNNKNGKATFDLFVRALPKDWGYLIVNGVEDAIDYATSLKFKEQDLDYLKQQNLFQPNFFNFLKDFKFTGDIWAIKEGTPVTANTPIMRVTADLAQAQFVETAFLNMVNFQTLIASKASRVVNAARPATVVDYGLRRAQEEDAAMKGARACYIGGALGTSNVKAGQVYGIPIKGTQAHSFIMSFPTELEAFRAYTKTFPDQATLLIDTYDTLQGARNAALVAKELEAKGKRLGGVRLDSGNLASLAKQVRETLDEQNLEYVKIFASNDLNEEKIQNLIQNEAPIDAYGVGTEMITAKPVAAIPGVYKLVEDGDGAKIKLAPDKITYPGKKQVYRVNQGGKYLYDILALENEQVNGVPLLEQVVNQGARVREQRNLAQVREYSMACVAKLPKETREVRARPYELRVSQGLQTLVQELTQKYGVGGK